MVEDKKQALKRFLRNYIPVVVAIISLITMLMLLVCFRILALVSIGDLSKINPLITSGQNKLVLKDGTSEIIKIPIDDTVASTGASDKGTPSNTSSDGSSSGKQASSGNTATGVTVQSSGGSGSVSSGNSNSNSGNGSSGSTSTLPSTPSPTPIPTLAAFTAGIGPKVTYETSNKSNSFNTCTITYKFTFTVTAQNAPGVAKAQWRWPGATWGSVFDVSFSAGQTSKAVSLQQYVNAGTSDQVISLRLNSPNAVEKDYGFKHQC